MNLLRLTRHLLPALLALTLVGTAKLQAQTAERPQRDAEHQKLAAFVGDWKYTGKLYDSPLGPGGTFAGREKVQWVMNGLFLESRGKDSGIYGGKKMTYEGVSVRWYDTTSKTFRDQSYDSDGFIGNGETTVNGPVWTSQGRGTSPSGKKSMSRGTTTVSADGKSRTSKGEVSLDDGKTWQLLWEMTAKKR